MRPTINKVVEEQPLHVKYRPKTFDQVIGQDAIVSSLKGLLKRTTPHAYLFTGPSGCGKTTIARILARELGISENEVSELDAATYSGIDNMREVTNNMRFRAFGSNAKKFTIIDECHALSKSAWQAMLLSIEEPAPHGYWCFCTTEPERVPRTIKTRCHAYEVRPIPVLQLYDYLCEIADGEGFTASDDAIHIACKEASGSVRQALVNLSAVRSCKTKQEAREILTVAQQEGDFIQLARLLCDGKCTWQRAMQALEPLKDQSAEGLRISIVNYAQKIALNPKGGERQVMVLLAVIEAFSRGPYATSDKMAPLLLAIGSLCFGR